MRRALIAIFVASLLVAGGVLVGMQFQENSLPVVRESFSELFAEAPHPLTGTCVVDDADILIDETWVSSGNIVVVSTTGDIHVAAPLQTVNGAAGTEQSIHPASLSTGTHYVVGESGEHGGSILLLAPLGTITVEAELRTGDGGAGKDVAATYSDWTHRTNELGTTNNVRSFIYGGYGGFGGGIYLGAQDVQWREGTLFPGAGGKGGDATLDGALRLDEAKAGHGGMSGQAYLLDPTFAASYADYAVIQGPNAATPRNSPSFICDNPVPFYPDEILPAQVIQPAEPTCRGGDGGNALTIGLFAGGTENGWDVTVAGVAKGGNGGWGCPGGNGGNAETRGQNGVSGTKGEAGECAPNPSGAGQSGTSGESGGLGGHAIAGDGGAGAPGQNLLGARMPTPLLWFLSWGTEKVVKYTTEPGWPTSWPQVDGQRPEFTVEFPIIGDATWYSGGNGGTASSSGGNGGDAGDGGDGRNGPVPGAGGQAGTSGKGAEPVSSFGGWSGPGARWTGTPGEAIAQLGSNGARGLAGATGTTTLQCSD